ncbi:L,D-transpeptidase family protein [Nocardioides cavernae]|uniref:L,D-transpeptidase family protein n=1 Tax=Nocardioides cavernae TaxID=1921566 RepID=A0ABR8NII3_9ACTN|nr:Ig-like domain-containing protein [Nocardioides cavernae]MBD3926970.1 L,D-transpeptidase family protein [Nocardioides cavernae]MBM7512690.1 lipoprotein-anchoring transpeptidase ErfK/SrfK [Nocardioides cavernae]
MRTRALRSTRPAHRRTAAAAALLMLSAGLAACSSSPTSDDGSPGGPGDTPGASQAAQVDPVRLTTSFTDPTSVPIDAPVTVSADGGDLSDVRVTSAAGPVEGRVQGGTWTSTSLLEPGTDYRISASATRSDGEAVERTRAFHTIDLTLDQQTYPSIAPLDGETVGVGMPVVVTFDIPVTDRALFEKHMNVTSTPAQKGSWYWLSDSEAHFRPARYWKAGTDVSVDLDLNSLPAGNGIYGQEDRQLSFHVGDAHVYRVNAQTHQMQVFSNGDLLRTLPITTGKPGFTTRSGVKVIMEKFETRRMNSETVGINRNSPEAYDIDDVRWAMRVTYSGEFIHAAPWSAGSQGYANVSHGCTGMSTADAGWLYAMTRRGDVVEYTGTDRQMTLENGYGDWNLAPAAWKQGSALS